MTTNADESFVPNLDWHHCLSCGDHVHAERWSFGERLCRPCGEALARETRKSWTVVPMHKSNYFLCTDKRDLVGINNKGGLVK